MKGVIAHRFVGRFLHPGIESGSQRLTFVLDRKVDQRSRAAERGRARASFKVICARRSSERHVEMRMHVDSTGENILSRRINNSFRIFARQTLADRGDLSIADCNVSGEGVSRIGNAPVSDDGVKAH